MNQQEMQQELEFFEQYKQVCEAYRTALSTLNFDAATVAPEEGLPQRNKLGAILAGEAFSYQTNPESLKRLENLLAQAEPGGVLEKELKLYFRELEDVRALPKEVYIRQRRAEADGHSVWRQAKLANEFEPFRPALKEIIQTQKEALAYLEKDCSDYDYLLDRFEQGTSAAMYDQFFGKIKEKLLPLIQKIQREGKKIDTAPLYLEYDLKEQEKFVFHLLEYMQMNPNQCGVAETEHPFTDFFSDKETRIAVHYYPRNPLSVVMSTIHEYGHGLYGLQVKPEYNGTAFKNAIGYAMHESQSRLLENHIGRSRAFWQANYPAMQRAFPAQLGSVTLDQFVEMINASQPSLIRIEADELTYPIHILIRYELEKAIFDGSLDLDKLDQAWADQYERYLGVRPQGPAQGILQDGHWGGGSFGYFPTYALGSAYAAQFFCAMERQIDVDQALRAGDFQKISGWLKENIHQYGAEKTADEILRLATGEPFNPDYYIDYLTEKYSALYFGPESLEVRRLDG